MKAFFLTLALTGTPASIYAADAGTSGPNPDTLLNAGQDDAAWILPAKTYSGKPALQQVELGGATCAPR
jgi:hypothetical protein